MSKELIEKNGKIVGSAAYFQEMNRNCKITEVMKVQKNINILMDVKKLRVAAKRLFL